MKKYLFIATLACMVLGLNSCHYRVVTETVYESNFKTLDLRVNTSDWRYSEDGGYYFCTLSIPELTSTIYNYGVITCYREYNKGSRDAYQLPLPQTLHNIDNGSGVLYTTTIDYSFAIGMVEIVLTNNDFQYAQPEGMDFRLNMTW